MRIVASCLCAALVLAISALPASAQGGPDAPAHVSVVDGAASLERDGRPDPAPLSMPLVAGDRLRTADGRLEILFADGATLHLDGSTIIDVQSDQVIRLLEGRVRLTIPGAPREVSYRIDAPAGWVQVQGPGEYRVTVTGAGREPEVELVVLRGAAELFNDNGQTTLRAGERAFARAGLAPSHVYVYNSAAWDAFDRWSNDRRADRAGISAQYLPETVRPYSSAFDRYGSWRHETSYGYVWYPTVSPGWRPYFEGRWASLPAIGWTWVGSNAWAWPTHHYGRWGFSAGAWFWIPGRTWGPAWVSWAAAPGYISWCPLGWDNRPVAFFGGGHYSVRHDPWRAWTIVPHHRFGTGYVHASFVGGSRIDRRIQGAFVVRPTPPEIRGYAVPRTGAPIYAAGSRGPGRSGYGVPHRVAAGRSSEGGGLTSADGPSAEGRRGVGATPSAVARERAFSTRVDDGSPTAPRIVRGAGAPLGRSGAARTREAGPGIIENRAVAVYRGGMPRTPEEGESGGPESQRLEVPGYRRAPSSDQARPRVVSPTQPWSAIPRRQPASNPPASDAVVGSEAGARGRSMPGPHPVDVYRATPRATPETAQLPAYRPYAVERRGSPSGPPTATAPRQDPERIAPPATRAYGPVDRRRASSAPPPAAVPARESGSPAPDGAPGEGSGGRSRPAGQGGGDRGTAVRRPAGR